MRARTLTHTYARDTPSVRTKPGISLSPPLATFLLLLLLLFRVDARGIHSAVEARGYRIGDRPFFGDPNRPIDLSPSSLPPRKFDENHPLLPRGIVPLRAPLSSCACFDHPSFRDDFSGHFVKGRNEGVSTVFRWGNVFNFF